MGVGWPALSYESWSASCDTLHAHTQVLGKLAVQLAPPEPQLQHAALRLTARGWETLEFRAPFRGRSTPVNAWWGTFDLAVSFFSGRPADPPSDDFIMRNGGDAEQVGIGWWPGDPSHERTAFFGLAYPAPDGFADAELSPVAARWDTQLGEYVLDWEDIRESPDPHALALEFTRSAFRHACAVCEWDPALAATAEGVPPPIR
jgi:Family of unknown function (DUF5996)